MQAALAGWQGTPSPCSRIVEGDEAALIAVIRADQPEHAVRVTGALLAGGVSAIEITFTIPGAARGGGA